MNPIKSIARRTVRELARQGLLTARTASVLLHRIALGRFPNLKDPRDLNEKIMWMEFNTDTSCWSELADKIEVRKYVKEKGLEDILLDQYAYFDKPEQISLDSLPDSFVMKTNNGNAQTLIVPDKSKMTERELQKIAAKWLRSKTWKASGEPHYGRIKPRILFEQLLPGAEVDIPVDYKFMCFNGKAEYCLVCPDRESQHFESKLELFELPGFQPKPDMVVDKYRPDNMPKRPKNIEYMIQCAETLAKGFPFVRIDLYNISGKVFFGEMTFTPAAARNTGISPNGLLELGNMLSIRSCLNF